MTPAVPRWVLSAIDGRSHVLTDNTMCDIGIVVALCGHVMPSSVDVSEEPPSRDVCGTCEPLAAFEVPPPVLPAPTVSREIAP